MHFPDSEKLQNKKSNLSLEGCNIYSILHFDGFNLNAVIKNRHRFNFRFCSSILTYLSP